VVLSCFQVTKVIRGHVVMFDVSPVEAILEGHSSFSCERALTHDLILSFLSRKGNGIDSKTPL
jgi:hypothetical protein